jgi:hypothetical protein
VNHRLAVTILAALLALTVAGCGSSNTPTVAEPPAAPTTTVAEPAATTTTLPAVGLGVAREVAPIVEPVVELDTEQVVTAAVLIASGGDLEAAIIAGLIGEAEAEAALRALETGAIEDLLG